MIKTAIYKRVSQLVIFTLLSSVLLTSLLANASERAEQGWVQVKQGALLIDVRTPQEFNSQHIKGAVNYPLNTLPQIYNQLDKNQSIVVYCRSGNRSGQAKRFLEQNGFTNVHNAGGLSELISTQ